MPSVIGDVGSISGYSAASLESLIDSYLDVIQRQDELRELEAGILSEFSKLAESSGKTSGAVSLVGQHRKAVVTRRTNVTYDKVDGKNALDWLIEKFPAIARERVSYTLSERVGLARLIENYERITGYASPHPREPEAPDSSELLEFSAPLGRLDSTESSRVDFSEDEVLRTFSVEELDAIRVLADARHVRAGKLSVEIKVLK